VLPELDLSDPTWGQLLRPSGAVEFGKDTTTRVVSIMLHVRGAGDNVLPVIFRSAAALGCRPADCSQGELMVEPEAPAWRAFQFFRDHALRRRGRNAMNEVRGAHHAGAAAKLVWRQSNGIIPVSVARAPIGPTVTWSRFSSGK